jgi:hypothetical protein
MMSVFWGVAPYSMVEIDRHFRGAYLLNHQGIVTLLMELVRTSETSVFFYQTTLRNIPEGSHLYSLLAAVRT